MAAPVTALVMEKLPNSSVAGLVRVTATGVEPTVKVAVPSPLVVTLLDQVGVPQVTVDTPDGAASESVTTVPSGRLLTLAFGEPFVTTSVCGVA